MTLYEIREMERAEGKAEGKVEGRAEAADRMIRAGKYSDEEIAEISGLTLEQVRNRKKIEKAVNSHKEKEEISS